ncbi:putative Ubiquitin domain-containing protein [Helianthus anomalus]
MIQLNRRCFCFVVEPAAANRVRMPSPWSLDEPMSPHELREMRDFFWSTAPKARRGRRVIWEALRDAAECGDLDVKQRLLDMHNIRLGNPDMTICIDGSGTRYKLPMYVLSDPTNLN